MLTFPQVMSQVMLLRDSVPWYFKNVPGVDETNHFDRYLPTMGRAFVECSDDDDILVEAETQEFFYRLAQEDSLAPRIPQVYGAFCDDDG